MSQDAVILIPPSEEQATASFHVEAALADRFLAFLRQRQIPLWQPPEPLGRPDPSRQKLVELEVGQDVEMQRLEAARRDFLLEIDS